MRLGFWKSSHHRAALVKKKKKAMHPRQAEILLSLKISQFEKHVVSYTPEWR